MDGEMEESFSPVAMEVWSNSLSEEEEDRSFGSQEEEEEEERRRKNNNKNTEVLCRELMQVLCSERVGQVTKTYHDIEAVTHLLEEKERDLELAARIGQSLLKQNRDLTARNELMDEQLEAAREEISQLRHELSMRDDLLQLYASTEERESAGDARSPMFRNDSSSSLSSFIQYDFLHSKLKGLEEENFKLRTEANDLTSETTNYEEQEQQLMMVCVEELSSVNQRMAVLSEELSRKVEDSLRQQEEISTLLAQIVDLQARCKGLTSDNEELTQHLTSSRESQSQLRSELRDLQDKYSELEDMLREAREDMKNLRNKSAPNSTVQRYSALAAAFPMDSLAAEIEGTFRKGLDIPAPPEYKNHPWRVFETVKVVNQSRWRSRGPSPGGGSGGSLVPGSSSPGAGGGSGLGSAPSTPSSTPRTRTSCYGSDSASLTLEYRGAGGATGLGQTGENSSSPGGLKRLGQPGDPGGHDLEAALRSLSARQQSHASSEEAESGRAFFEVERERKLRKLTGRGEEGEEREEGEGSSGFLTPNDSACSAASSTATNYSNGSSSGSGRSGGSRSYLPDRLQIVKPLEGSVTLHHWQQLAQPTLGGVLYPRPGVLTKDFRELEADRLHVYSLLDLEEDEPDLSQPCAGLGPAHTHGNLVTPSGPNLPHTPSTHTITTCPLHHPSLLIPSSSTSLHPHSLPACGSCEPLSTSTPHHHGNGLPSLTLTLPSSSSSSSSSSTTTPPSLGLLRLLQEQGITASPHPHPLPTYPYHTLLTTPTAREEAGGVVASSTVEEEVKKEEGEKTNIFSFNLMEKLHSLGLHKMAAREAVVPEEEEEERTESRAVRHPPKV